MRCPGCGSMQVNVEDSRAAGSTRLTPSGKKRRQTPVCVEKRWGTNYIFRKRKCLDCQDKWSTVEVVITSNGHRARSIKW